MCAELHRSPSGRSTDGRSPRPLACDEDENSADGNETVLEGRHGQDGELGSVFQRKYSKQPPAPGWPAGTGLQENTVIYNGYKALCMCPLRLFTTQVCIKTSCLWVCGGSYPAGVSHQIFLLGPVFLTQVNILDFAPAGQTRAFVWMLPPYRAVLTADQRFERRVETAFVLPPCAAPGKNDAALCVLTARKCSLNVRTLAGNTVFLFIFIFSRLSMMGFLEKSTAGRKPLLCCCINFS